MKFALKFVYLLWVKIVLRVRKLSCAVAAVDNFEERTPCVRGDMAGG